MDKIEELKRLFVEAALENTIYNNLSKDNYPSNPRNLLETASLCSYNVDRNLKESENLVSCCKGYSGGSLEDLKNILSEEDFKKLEEDE